MRSPASGARQRRLGGMAGDGDHEAQKRSVRIDCALIVRLPSGAAIELANASQAVRGRGIVARMGEGAVLSFTGSLKVCVALHPIDLRKSFNGLHGMVTERLGEDPRTGALVRFRQQAAHAHQDFVLGRNWLLGDDQAAGTGNFFLAARHRSHSREAATGSRSAGVAHRWHRSARRENAAVV